MRGFARRAGFNHPARRIAYDNLVDTLSGLEFHVADLHGACNDGRQACSIYIDELPGLRQHGRGAAPGPISCEIERSPLFCRQGYSIRPQKVVEEARGQRCFLRLADSQGRSRQNAQKERGSNPFHTNHSPVVAGAMP